MYFHALLQRNCVCFIIPLHFFVTSSTIMHNNAQRMKCKVDFREKKVHIKTGLYFIQFLRVDCIKFRFTANKNFSTQPPLY